MDRVLHSFGCLRRGGLETFVMNVYRNIDRSKLQFDFLVNIPGGEYEDEVKKLGGRIFIGPQRNKGIIAGWKSINMFFKQHQGEWIALHQHVSSLSSIELQFFAKKYSIPIRILHAHSSSIASSVRYRHLHLLAHYISKLFVTRWATHFLGCSNKAIDWLYSGTSARKKAVMINNGIESEKFSFNEKMRNIKRQEFNISADVQLVGHVGTFISVKNHTFLLKIFDAYNKSEKNSKLLLIGDGPLRENIMNEVKELGLENCVIFAGVRSDVNELLQAIDIVVMPSLFEGLPVSLVEAQAAGLPILASDTISYDTKITDNLHFFSLENSAQAWAAKMSEILNDFNREDTTSQIVESGFDVKYIAENLSNLYLSKSKSK